MDRNYLLRRVTQAVLTVWVVVTITFGLTRLMPGDPRTFLMAMSAGRGNVEVPPEEYMDSAALDPGHGPLVQYVDSLHWPHPRIRGVARDLAQLLDQYVDYMTLLAQGDLGMSTGFSRPVADILAEAIPWTVFLVATSLPLTFGIGIVLGAFMAYYQGTLFDKVASTISTLLNSIPYYIAAVVMVWILGLRWGIFPRRNRKPPGVEAGFTPEFIGGVLYHAALPVASVVITYFGFRALAMRGNSIQVLGEDFVRVARLRGLPDDRIALQYVGRNAVLPVYTEFMIAMGVVLGNTVVIEQIFAYQGLGYYFFQAIGYRDYPLMMGAFLVIAIAVVIGLLLADLSYGLIDPRAAAGDGGSAGGGQKLPLLFRLRQVVVWLVRLPVRAYRWTLGILLGSTRRGAPTSEYEPGGPGDSEASQFESTAAEHPSRPDRHRQTATSEAETDAESLFETTAADPPSRRERYRRALDEYVLAPGRIIWSDVRARVGAAIILVYLAVGTLGVLLVPEPRPNQGDYLLGAFQSIAHPLGTNDTGQDMLSLLVHSTPDMLEMMFAGAVFATVVATVVGMVSAYFGGRTDSLLMFVSDVALAIPGLPLIMVLAVLFEPTDPWKIGVLVTVNAWGGTARQIRSQVLTIREESYVEASSIMSLSTSNILTRDVLPNILPFVFVRAADQARYAVVAGVVLYFLGVLPFDRHNWGVMLQMAYNGGALHGAEHRLVIPIIAIVGIILGVILFAQGTDAVFNPRVRARHAERIDAEGEEDESTGPTTGAIGDD